jgi:hypothetical protein
VRFVLRWTQSIATPYRVHTLELYDIFESGLNQARCNHHVCWNRHRKSQFNTDVTAESGYYQEWMKRNVALQWLAYIVAQLILSHEQDNSFQSKLYSSYSFRTVYLYGLYEASTKSTKLFGTNRQTTRLRITELGIEQIHYQIRLRFVSRGTASAWRCFWPLRRVRDDWISNLIILDRL